MKSRILILLIGCSALTGMACRADRASSTNESSAERRADGESSPGSSDTEEGVDEGVVYTVFDEAVSDTPIKTQIEQHVVARGIPSPKGLAAEIRRRYAAARARRDFKYHNPASNIYIYVYGSEEQARAEQGLWLGMIAKGLSDSREPEVQISETRLAALSAPSEQRFGLSEEVRQRVFREIAAAEERATREAMERVPDSRIMEQIELERKLAAEFKLVLARKHNLSEEQLTEISIEGVNKGWPWS